MTPRELQAIAESLLVREPKSERDSLHVARPSPAVGSDLHVSEVWFEAERLWDGRGTSFLGWVYAGWLLVEEATDLSKERSRLKAWLHDQLGPRCILVLVRSRVIRGWIRVVAQFRGEPVSSGLGPYRTAGARPARPEDDPQPKVAAPSKPPPFHFNACLVVIVSDDPALLGKRIHLDFRSISIGRSSSNDIVIAGDSVSRRHAHIARNEKRWYVHDNNSSHGTYRNDRLITGKAALSRGNRVKIGSTIFKFLSGPDVDDQYRAAIASLNLSDSLTGKHRGE